MTSNSSVQAQRVLNRKPARYVFSLATEDQDALQRNGTGISQRNIQRVCAGEEVTGDVMRKVLAYFTPPLAPAAIASVAATPAPA